jgi:hypothetical protein
VIGAFRDDAEEEWALRLNNVPSRSAEMFNLVNGVVTWSASIGVEQAAEALPAPPPGSIP